MRTQKRGWTSKQFLVIITLLLLINLPVISALELSNVQAEDITDASAVVKWDTNEPADSFVDYGTDKNNLEKIGDAKKITTHQMALNNLLPETNYVYSVESNDIVEDNSGSYYSFTTLAPDISPPELFVELPAMVPGVSMEITGWSEPGAEIKLFVDDSLAGSTVALVETETTVLSSVEEPESVEEESEDTTVEEIAPIEEEQLTEEPPAEEGTQTVITQNETVEQSIGEETNSTSEINNNSTEALAGQAIFGSDDDKEETEKPTGKFTFTNVYLNKDTNTNITIEATDSSGNKATFSGEVYSDSSKPKIELGDYPSIIDGSNFNLNVSFSETVNYEIFVNNNSVFKGNGTKINKDVSLQEGENNIGIFAIDVAGWEISKEFSISSDTQPPQVKVTFEKGNEFFQGRAVSSISGETEKGATVYLYVYRPQGYEYAPDFKRARQKVTADQNGSFIFKDVNFEREPISLDDFSPKQVPQGLQEYSISPVQLIEEQQRFSYYVFIIAEDAVGKSGHAQATVTINSCYSSNSDFDIQSLAQFQRPMRLDPGMLDEGREQVTAVFNLSYRGSGASKLNVLTGKQEEDAYKILEVFFDPACTQSMLNDDQFKLGCNILPPTPQKIASNDKSAWYLTYKLRSSEKLSDTTDDFWNEFKKRQIVFPLKSRVQYQERAQDGTMGPVKTQTSCYDLSYFIDIPIDSKDMLPDWLADEGLDAITYTINVIDNILPYLEKAILVTGYACIFSFLGRMTMRWVRIFTSKMEVYSTKLKDKDEQCPKDNNKLYMESTVEHWKEISSIFVESDNNMPPDKWSEGIKLDEVCPMTTNMWKVEAGIDQAYRWTCDRVFCRAVPAGWTSEKDKEEVDTVILEQQRCTASSRGIPLLKIENCQEKVQQDVTNPSQRAQALAKKGSFTCYQYNGKLYYITSEQEQSDVGEVVRLEKIHDFGLTLNQGASAIGYSDLIAYRPPGADNFVVGQDQSCKSACRNPRKPGYAPDTAGGISNYATESATSKTSNGCYEEKYVEGTVGQKTTLIGNGGKLVTGNKYSAGYTSDCFVNFDKGTGKITSTSTNETCSGTPRCTGGINGRCINGNCVYETASTIKVLGADSTKSTTGLLQCVCEYDEGTEKKYGARTAAKEKDGTDEDWIYRQSTIFKDTLGTQGTYYPEWRYYDGRDMSSAFGADYLTDYFRTDKTVHEVNPNTQFLGIYQTICLSGMRAHLIMLKSILEGLKGCIEQAKVTGLTDAGVCKTIFTQHICGLIYKAISYFFSDCTPLSMNDQKKGEGGVLGGVGEFFSSGFGSIGEAMDSSINDIKSDYGNAKLNEYFATGSRGFTESLCMAAFGYDFPLGMDFILDSAYAFPMKTVPMVFPAERELATFNPATGTAIYNYNVGAMVLPGCQIKSADVYLKCVGTEDQGHPGVQCGEQGCDCLYARDVSGVEGEKTKFLDKGRIFNIKQGAFTDLKIPSPQKVDSHYRYDHVVIDIRLDSYEDPEKCFDEGYKDGKFYFPIIDVSPPAEFVCQVQPTTGRYFCPEVVKLFGGADGSYLESPYMSCYNKDTQSFDDCTIPGLFIKGDEIKVKTHVVLGEESSCLKLTVDGLGPTQQNLGIRKMPKGLAGPQGVEVNLGTVTPELFSGAFNTLQLVASRSGPGCNPNPRMDTFPQGQLPAKEYPFIYQIVGGQYRVTLPSGVVPEGNYEVGPANVLKEKGTGREAFTGIELQGIQFIMDSFKVSGLIGSPTGTSASCIYQIATAAGQTYSQTDKPIQVTAELLMPDSSGNCFSATIPVKAPAFGKPKHTANILLQLEPAVSQITSKMHQEFMQDNCNFVLANAKEVINRINIDGTIGRNDLEDAIAIYYSVACHVIGDSNWRFTKKNEICTLLDIFFNRHYAVQDRFGEKYPDVGVKDQVEYQKIHKYLSEVQEETKCQGVTPSSLSNTGTTGSTWGPSTCGNEKAVFKVIGEDPAWQPTNWKNYVCLASTGQTTGDPNVAGSIDRDKECWSRGVYSTQEIADSLGVKFGCEGAQLCCPPNAGTSFTTSSTTTTTTAGFTKQLTNTGNLGGPTGSVIYRWTSSSITSWRDSAGTTVYANQIIYVPWLTNKWCKTDSQGSVGLPGSMTCASTNAGLTGSVTPTTTTTTSGFTKKTQVANLGSPSGTTINMWYNSATDVTSWRDSTGGNIYSNQVIYIPWLTGKQWCKTNSQGSVGASQERCSGTESGAQAIT